MLGSMIVDLLSRDPDLSISATLRDTSLPLTRIHTGVDWKRFDVLAPDYSILAGQKWIINAIGITKPLIKDDHPEQIERAVRVNSLFPAELVRAAGPDARILQIATDCVFSGARGRYLESNPHDALDVYGKTKSLGESYGPNIHHLRCSLIGPEPKHFKFLIEWFRRQPQGGQVNGFRNHIWNGITTLQFARLCKGIIQHHPPLGHLQHVIPSGHITKAAMLHVFAAAYNRDDIRINDVDAGSIVDRTLDTEHPGPNRDLWRLAGYDRPPTVEEMIYELASFDYRAAAQ